MMLLFCNKYKLKLQTAEECNDHESKCDVEQQKDEINPLDEILGRHQSKVHRNTNQRKSTSNNNKRKDAYECSDDCLHEYRF